MTGMFQNVPTRRDFSNSFRTSALGDISVHISSSIFVVCYQTVHTNDDIAMPSVTSETNVPVSGHSIHNADEWKHTMSFATTEESSLQFLLLDFSVFSSSSLLKGAKDLIAPGYRGQSVWTFNCLLSSCRTGGIEQFPSGNLYGLAVHRVSNALSISAIASIADSRIRGSDNG